ncbi:MAG: RdgB/HAM1 family non-canonical purine NTP pyrophosphatase [Candidatus Riflebacteria bacterium]|nr:RdgB/HAM1 family non-canonical purine NTP pyrophosphatase [Candidatus Riflebacteria bacterium]
MKLWVSTCNNHKLREIGEILGPGFEIASLLDFRDFPDVEETGMTFQANAAIKARVLWEHVHEPVFADDSGLEVDALNGRPGVNSKRYSAPDPTSEKNIDKLLTELDGIPDERRSARFRCAIIYIDSTGREHLFEGTLEGRIARERHGTGGFGYDPVFWLPTKNCSVAECRAEEKNAISHRGRAVSALKAFLTK